MLRVFAPAALPLLLTACGDLEADRICLGRPCQIPGRASAECLAYAACFEKTGGTPGALDSTYGEGGVCWTTGNPATAESCTAACGSAVSSLQQSFPDAGC